MTLDKITQPRLHNSLLLTTSVSSPPFVCPWLHTDLLPLTPPLWLSFFLSFIGCFAPVMFLSAWSSYQLWPGAQKSDLYYEATIERRRSEWSPFNTPVQWKSSHVIKHKKKLNKRGCAHSASCLIELFENKQDCQHLRKPWSPLSKTLRTFKKLSNSQRPPSSFSSSMSLTNWAYSSESQCISSVTCLENDDVMDEMHTSYLILSSYSKERKTHKVFTRVCCICSEWVNVEVYIKTMQERKHVGLSISYHEPWRLSMLPSYHQDLNPLMLRPPAH